MRGNIQLVAWRRGTRQSPLGKIRNALPAVAAVFKKSRRELRRLSSALLVVLIVRFFMSDPFRLIAKYFEFMAPRPHSRPDSSSQTAIFARPR